MIYTIFKDQAGKYRWRLRAKTKITIAISGEGYKRKKTVPNSINRASRSQKVWAVVDSRGLKWTKRDRSLRLMVFMSTPVGRMRA